MPFTTILYIALGALGLAGILLLLNLSKLLCICAPNEVLIFSGKRRRVGNRLYGYRMIKGGRSIRWPLIERVDSMDLTNMIIDVSAHNAYSKGGVPLTVQGVANVKIAGHEPVLNNAIERFLGRKRVEIMMTAKAVLEGALRGICATMTPEEVNEDKILFAERLVHEVEEDMTRLGLVVDTFKIQNVQDEVGYLDSIGRIKNAEIIRQARIAEATAKADAAVRAAENREREATAQIQAQIEIAKAEAQRRLRDALTRRDALVAEEKAQVEAALAQAQAEIEVQKARIEQVRRRLDADVVKPAKAACEAAINNARAKAAPIIADGEARAEVLTSLADKWKEAGKNARDVFLLQKMDEVIHAITSIISNTQVDQLTIIDSRTPSLTGDGSLPAKALATNEQFKQVLGIDLLELLRNASTKTEGTKQTLRKEELQLHEQQAEE